MLSPCMSHRGFRTHTCPATLVDLALMSCVQGSKRRYDGPQEGGSKKAGRKVNMTVSMFTSFNENTKSKSMISMLPGVNGESMGHKQMLSVPKKMVKGAWCYKKNKYTGMITGPRQNLLDSMERPIRDGQIPTGTDLFYFIGKILHDEMDEKLLSKEGLAVRKEWFQKHNDGRSSRDDFGFEINPEGGRPDEDIVTSQAVAAITTEDAATLPNPQAGDGPPGEDQTQWASEKQGLENTISELKQQNTNLTNWNTGLTNANRRLSEELKEREKRERQDQDVRVSEGANRRCMRARYDGMLSEQTAGMPLLVSSHNPETPLDAVEMLREHHDVHDLDGYLNKGEHRVLGVPFVRDVLIPAFALVRATDGATKRDDAVMEMFTLHMAYLPVKKNEVAVHQNPDGTMVLFKYCHDLGSVIVTDVITAVENYYNLLMDILQWAMGTDGYDWYWTCGGNEALPAEAPGKAAYMASVSKEMFDAAYDVLHYMAVQTYESSESSDEQNVAKTRTAINDNFLKGVLHWQATLPKKDRLPLHSRMKIRKEAEAAEAAAAPEAAPGVTPDMAPKKYRVRLLSELTPEERKVEETLFHKAPRPAFFDTLPEYTSL